MTISNDIINEIVNSAEDFCKQIKQIKNHRYNSWEYCYCSFEQARKDKDKGKKIDYDYLSLNLAFYLASWGMYRGSTFLLQRDYKVHLHAVIELLDDYYKELYNIDWTRYYYFDKENNLISFSNSNPLKKFNELYNRLFTIYCGIGSSTKIDSSYDDTTNIVVKGNIDSEPTDTLITKILLGTLGCIPAYDTYLKNSIKQFGIGFDSIKKRKDSNVIESTVTLKKLIILYKENDTTFETLRRKLTYQNQIDYPQMKILDMGLWYLQSHFKNNVFKRFFTEDKYFQYGKIGKKIFDIIDKNKQMGFDCEYLYNKIIRIKDINIDYIIKGVILCNKNNCDSLDIFTKSNRNYNYISLDETNKLNKLYILNNDNNSINRIECEDYNYNNNNSKRVIYVITQNNDSDNIKNWKLVYFKKLGNLDLHKI